MSPSKQIALGIGGCVLVPGPNSYRLKDGKLTYAVAVTVSLAWAEPCLRRLLKSVPVACADAAAAGFRLVRTYDEAVMNGLA